MERKFIVRSEAIQILESNIAKMNEKISKWDGFNIITLEINDSFYRDETEDALLQSVKYIHITINGEIPHYNGWTFVASLDYDRENECVFVFNLSKSVYLPKKYENATSIGCDHCNHNRFRVKSFIIYNDQTDEYKEVGSSCLKKFFPQDISKLIPFINMMGGIEEKLNYGGKSVYYYDSLEFLICVKYCIDKYGWVSAKMAWNNDKVESTMVSTRRIIGSEEVLKIKTTQIQHAKKVIKYFSSLEDQTNSYMINLCKICTLDFVKSDKLGILASAFSAYERVDHEPKPKNAPTSKFIGKIKERFRDMKVEVTFKKFIENDFGGSTLYKFKDACGNIISTFYSGTKFDLELNEKITMTATVTKHDVFRDEKQTVVNRMCIN